MWAGSYLSSIILYFCALLVKPRLDLSRFHLRFRLLPFLLILFFFFGSLLFLISSSYCMDGLAMALHCVWTTDSFPGAVLKAVNKRGDADTVGAITGQIAGAIYGYTKIPHDWIETIRQWDPHNTIAIRAYKLFNHQFVQQA
eukprot:m.83463 g.83463  ORF g.83463 m.83463 type:complete len:142 (-) comp14345_c1_seq2:134-559(-)